MRGSIQQIRAVGAVAISARTGSYLDEVLAARHTGCARSRRSRRQLTTSPKYHTLVERTVGRCCFG